MERIPKDAGGTSQGLSLSGTVDGCLPLQLIPMTLAATPAPCVAAHPLLLPVFHTSWDRNDCDIGFVFQERVRIRSERILSYMNDLAVTSDQILTDSIGKQILAEFTRRCCNAERVWFLDLVASRFGSCG